MYCLKCGRESREVFCEDCQNEAKSYPVKPDTPAIIYDRNAYFAQKKLAQPKRKITPERRIIRLRKVIKFLLILWGITAVALAVFILLWLFF